MLAPFVFFAEGLSSHEICIDKRHLVGVFHRKINVLGMPEGNLIIVGILQRHLVATEVRKDVIPPVLPGAGGVKDVCQLVHQGRFTAGFAPQDRHRAHEKRLHFGGNILPVAERVFADLRAANVHKGALRIDQHRFDPEMLQILRGVRLFRGVDPVRLDPFLFHKRLNAVAPDIPAVGIGLHPLFVKGMDTDIFLVLKGLQQPAQAIGNRRLLGHGARLKQLAVTRIVVAHDDMQLVHLATGALNQINMAGMQRIKFPKHHADVFLHTREFKPEEAVQGFKLLRAGAFDFGIQQLAQIAFGHTAGLRHLLQSAALLADSGLDIVK